MPAFLKIENIGCCPPEGFTVLGVSLADTTNNKGVIGQFGSGNKHAVAVLLRNKINPVVFSGTLRLDFGTKPQKVSDNLSEKEFGRVFVKYGGVDANGTNRSNTEDLGFVVDYGKHDWDDMAMALREFVSNAIDRSIRERGDWSGVKIEVVEENQIRAKRDHTRVFVPLNEDVLKFYNNLGKWFLHFSEPESLSKSILPKRNRNLDDSKTAVIYRRGVRVREFTSSDTESLLDYNLNDLTIDEARKASDWDVQHHCGRALASADEFMLRTLFWHMFNDNKSYWEHSFDLYSLQPSWNDKHVDIQHRTATWQSAFFGAFGENAVLTTESNVNQLERKGYVPVVAPQHFIVAAAQYGVPTPTKVLSVDETLGRNVIDALPNAETAVNAVWELLEKHHLTNGKSKPSVKCFTTILDGGVMLNGYYRDEEVFINSDLAGGATVDSEGLPNRLLKVALEEIAHHVTGATDCSRDFQDFLLELTVKMFNTQ